MKAFIVQEPDEGTGGVIFAKSNIAARRIGADEYNGGEFGGLSVHRAPGLDQYAESGVPAHIMIAEGWWFECSGCDMRINEENLSEEGLPVSGVVGTMDGPVFCCAHRHEQWTESQRRKREAGAAFLEKLRQHVGRRLGAIDFVSGEFKEHVYVVEVDGHLIVRRAVVSFKFPGMAVGPASLRYDETQENGPQPLVFYCCSGDKEAFEAFASAGRAALADGGGDG